MSKSNGYSLADFIFNQMEKDGFTVSSVTGAPGHEIVTFKNSEGETRTLECGFSRQKPKNYRVYFNPNDMKLIRPSMNSDVSENTITIKVDYNK